MKTGIISKWIFLAGLVILPFTSHAFVKGIYVTQPTLESTRTIKYLIEQSKAVGISTFVIDYWGMSKLTRQNIALVKQNNIRFVARITMFPFGAEDSQVKSQAYLQKRYRQIMEAVALGADSIQLDYIRYKPTQRPSPQNAINIYQVISHIRQMLQGKGVGLQVDVFGVSSFKEALYIGQYPALFARSLDAINPMVYPSHYDPFRYYAVRPYQTVFDSLTALREQIKSFPRVKVYAFIELYNYRYPLGHDAKVRYILDEMRAVRDSGADGYYVWSANNRYNILFAILRMQHN
jgi:hypothetical protein